MNPAGRPPARAGIEQLVEDLGIGDAGMLDGEEHEFRGSPSETPPRPGAWKFARKTVVLDSRQIDTWRAIPL